jgi:hypothetical protein
VTDNSVPPLSATNSFAVIVTGPYDGIDFADGAQALADPDRDGFPNLLEYALGTDPHNSADAQNAMVISVIQDAGAQYVSLQFKRRKLSPGLPLQYIPEVSGDQQTWYSDESHVLQLSVTGLDAQFDSVTVKDLIPTTSAAPRFIRLRVGEN